MDESFVLRATPSIKRYNIARFDTTVLPNFKACSQPVMMYREPEKVFEEDENEKKEEIGYNPALRKRRRRRRKDSRTAGWVIEDSEGKNAYNGAHEGGQASTYMLLIKNRHNDEFNVIPVEQWFRFKKPLGYRTLTLEEAEEMNNEKKRAVERWLMRHKLAGEDKVDTDLVSAPKLRTGAIGTGAPRGTMNKETGDIFEVKETKQRRAFRPKKSVNEADATGENGGDFEEKFDDDESEAEVENDNVAGVPSDSEEEEVEGDADAQGKLTETGQAMKDLLKRAQNGEIDAAKEKKEEDATSSDDEYTAKDMEKIRRDLGGNIIWDQNSAAAISNTSNSANNTTNAAGTAASKPESEAKGASGNQSVNGKKRKHEESSKAKDDPTSKQQSKSANSSLSLANKLTEAGVQQELMRYGGRMRTKYLLRKLRKSIVTDDDRSMLKDILRTICDVETDAVDGRMLVLKSQFR
uniref:Transcription initiation factor IIF subunit alpha n=1 Tax=Albugo laibachii Nc14 TaxID=890382 RepID=F0WXS8_9STRA|nr:conserved hypothetical protein [Albugo laibachii Nc14]|eukprot:CCA26276.1 conserved hypothetical protein [Albugo laibachii Nc14]